MIKKKDTPLFDRIWVVFDKNSFPPDNYNRAVDLAEKNGFGCACSNEAFELWYLLHFVFFDTAISRDQYQVKLSKRVHMLVEELNSYLNPGEII